MLTENTKVILIASPVFKANFVFLKNQEIPIINKESIDTPCSGGQKKYRDKMLKIFDKKMLEDFLSKHGADCGFLRVCF